MRQRLSTILPLARPRPSPPSICARPTTSGQRQFHLDLPAYLHSFSPPEIVGWTAQTLSSLHTFGLPWLITIPLVAVGFNFAVRLPIQYYNRRLAMKRKELDPLVMAWSFRHIREIRQISVKQGDYMHLAVARCVGKSRSRIYKTWGVQRWKALSYIFSLGPFIVFSESLRRICGAPFGWIGRSLLPSGADPSAVSAALYDETLTYGGVSWISDLTAADPYCTLPLLCSAILARNVWGRLTTDRLRVLLGKVDPEKPTTPLQKVHAAIGRVLLLMPFFPLAIADLPSAVFVYWAAMFALTEVNESIVEHLVPKPKPKFSPPEKRTMKNSVEWAYMPADPPATTEAKLPNTPRSSGDEAEKPVP